MFIDSEVENLGNLSLVGESACINKPEGSQLNKPFLTENDFKDVKLKKLLILDSSYSNIF
ncbi:hypothetical protein IKQ21_01670 [bacterium]|nr:hypothetical protein [bacterium]